MTKIEEIRKFMEKMGIPGRDLYDLPTSKKAFPDGANYRIEIAGVERPSNMKVLVDEAKKRDLPIHRAIATVGGATYCDFSELKEMAHVAKEAKIEVIMTIGQRLGWDPGAKESTTAEGQQNGWRLRGSDNISYWIHDVMRCVEAGFRGFLVYDEGILSIVTQMRKEGMLPPETIFKISVFAGYRSAAGAKVVESMGGNTLNPPSDISLPILAGIRKAVNIPLDVYVIIVDSFGGMFRANEAAEIARVASPCYFKFEPGISEGVIYKPWMFEEFHDRFIREKVKIASIVREIVGKMNPAMKLSDWGPKDLVLPVVK
ncbi:MAG: hypothetical protein A2169_13030 [Deltaproteobacteria bacterium RBG_13_47_9]|nr:MAG: hypothetical protein A2169_13030 [Deltaproteobacteria bacterium RBG_13_47_9]